MYQVGDSVVYSTYGICQVTAVGMLSMSQASPEKLYYTLQPVFRKDSVVYVPTTYSGPSMRPVLSRDDLKHLLADIPAITPCPLVSTKERDTYYKERLTSSDLRQSIAILKTLWKLREDCTLHNKHMSQIDEKYFRIADNQVSEEFSYVFGIRREDVPSFIQNELSCCP